MMPATNLRSKSRPDTLSAFLIAAFFKRRTLRFITASKRKTPESRAPGAKPSG